MTAIEVPINVVNYANFDLHSNEALEQTLHNLNQIEQSLGKCEVKIMNRMKNIFSKMQNLQERAILANKKIQALKTANKPLIVTTPSKYVTPYAFDKTSWHTNVFQEMYQKPPIHQINHSSDIQIEHSDQQLGKPCKIDFKEVPSIINQMYCQIKQSRKLFEGQFALQNLRMYDGLEKQPKGLKYLDSLLVFNSKANPYSKYKAFDNIQKQQQKRVTQIRENAKSQAYNLMNNTHLTILDRISMQKNSGEGYLYNPNVEHIEDIQIQDNLVLDNVYDLNQNPLQKNSDLLLPSQVKKNQNLNLGNDKIFENPEEQKIFISERESLQLQQSVYNKYNYTKLQSNSNPPVQQQQQLPAQNQYNQIQQHNVQQSAQQQVHYQSDNHQQIQTQQEQKLLDAPPIDILNFDILNLNSKQEQKQQPQQTLEPPPMLILNEPLQKEGKPIIKEQQQKPEVTKAKPANDGRRAFLADIVSMNPLERLKKTVTKDSTTLTAFLNPQKKAGQAKGKGQPSSMSLQDQLKEQLRQRFANMNPDHEDSDED